MGKKINLVVLIVLVVIGTISYYPSFEAPFVFDDLRVIVKDRKIHIKELSVSALKPLVKESRPVAIVSFALNYYFSRLSPFGFHLVNLIIHILTAFIMYLFLYDTLNLPSLEDKFAALSHPIAFASSILFVAHPVNSQTVIYTVQRMTSLAAMFFLLSMLLYVKGRVREGKLRVSLYLLSFIAFVLAFKSKENAATLPVFIAIYEIYFFQQLDWGRIKKISAYLIGLVGVPLVVSSIYWDYIVEKQQVLQFTLGEKLLTELRVLIYYISLLFFPHPSRLNMDYDFPISRSLFNPATTFLSLLGFIGLLFLGFYLAKKKPVISFGIAWFIGNLVIESTVVPIELIYEHRLYLPCVGFFLVITSVFLTKMDSWKNPPLPKKWLNSVVLFLLIAVFSMWTYHRSLVWRNSLSLWEDVVKKSPDSGRAHDNLALAYFRMGQYEKAIAEHIKGIKLGGPGIVKKYNNLGNAYFKTRQFDKAIKAYRQSLAIDAGFVEARNGLGCALNSKGEYQEAEKELRKVAELNPNHLGVYSNLGMVYFNMKRYDKALEEYQRALKFTQNDVKVHSGLAKTYSALGEHEKSINEYKKVLAFEPNNPVVYNSLGSTYARAKMYPEAEKAFLKALSLNSNYFEARKHLGNIYYLLKWNDKAVGQWEKALALNPKDKVLAKNLEIVRRSLKTP